MLSVATASKTQRLSLWLRHQILSGELNPGDKLPSEPELGSLHGVSLVTVRRVLGQLEDEDFISRRPAASTFVKERPVSRPIVAELSEALANLNKMGRATSVKLLFAYVKPPIHVATSLRTSRETQTQRSVRIAHARQTVTATLAPEIAAALKID